MNAHTLVGKKKQTFWYMIGLCPIIREEVMKFLLAALIALNFSVVVILENLWFFLSLLNDFSYNIHHGPSKLIKKRVYTQLIDQNKFHMAQLITLALPYHWTWFIYSYFYFSLVKFCTTEQLQLWTAYSFMNLSLWN